MIRFSSDLKILWLNRKPPHVNLRYILLICLTVFSIWICEVKLQHAAQGKTCAVFLKKSIGYFPPPNPPPPSHLPLSRSLPFYSPCLTPLFVSLLLYLSRYMTHRTRRLSCNLAFLFHSKYSLSLSLFLSPSHHPLSLSISQ